MSKLSVCVDFDGVIHKYDTEPEVHNSCEILDGPVDGAFDWLREVVKKYHVIIFSARFNDPGSDYAVCKWFIKHGLEFSVLDQLDFYAKPKAKLYIDDRGFQFSGHFPSLESIEDFKAWNKR